MVKIYFGNNYVCMYVVFIYLVISIQIVHGRIISIFYFLPINNLPKIRKIVPLIIGIVSGVSMVP